MSLFTELKRRQVVKIAAAYLVFAWLIIQVTDTVAPALHLPPWILTMVVWISIICFLPAMLFVWVFQMTPAGLRRDEGEGRTPSDPVVSRRMNVVLSLLLLLAVGYIVIDFTSEGVEDEPVEPRLAQKQEGTAESDYNSIAVLPFVNLSSDPEQEYLSDGLAEELLNLLAQLDALQVAARTSSFSFKGKNMDVRAIGAALAVDTVLEGSVRKAGNRIRVTAQLIDTANGYHLWSDTYDRELSDIFAIQDEVSASIVGALRVHLADDAPAASIVNIEAYDLFLRARELARSSELEEALRLFRQSTETDPNFAAAWAARAEMVLALRETDFWGDIPREEAFALASANIERALTIDPQSAEALTSQGELLWEQYLYEEALASIAQALESNPNLARGYEVQSRLLGARGNVDAAWESLERAMDLDPLDNGHLRAGSMFMAAFPKPAFRDALLQRAANLGNEKGLFLGNTISFMYNMAKIIDPLGTFHEVMAALQKQGKVFDDIKMPASLFMIETFAEMRSAWLPNYKNPDEIEMEMAFLDGNFDQALVIYQALPDDRGETAVNLERLSLIQLGLGNCAASLSALDKAHGGELRIYTQVPPDYERSNPNLAANRAWCLRLQGDIDEAKEVVAATRVYYDRILRDYGSFHRLEAKLLIAAGDNTSALTILEQGAETGSLKWAWLNDGVLLQALGNEPRFAAVRQEVWGQINERRNAVGWPPTDGQVAWDSGDPLQSE